MTNSLPHHNKTGLQPLRNEKSCSLLFGENYDILYLEIRWDRNKYKNNHHRANRYNYPCFRQMLNYLSLLILYSLGDHKIASITLIHYMNINIDQPAHHQTYFLRIFVFLPLKSHK